jgi:uncharacterized protein YdeI (YjbR/CyaY-like superfamily)
VRLAIERAKEWPEPEVPQDLQNVLAADPQILILWMDITPMARWDWIRWMCSTKQPKTRRRRIEAASSIRGAKDAPKYKDIILPLIFTKRLVLL